MKNFKELLDMDLESTFYNTDEFAQIREVKIDGIKRKIPVIFDSEATEARNGKDSAEGFYQRYIVIRVMLSSIEEEPRQGMRLWLDENLYVIVGVQNEYNELIIDLERYDE